MEQKKNLMCRHCDDSISPRAYCDVCNMFLVNQCKTCHNEVAHNVVKIGNIHTHCGRQAFNAARADGVTKILNRYTKDD